MKLITLIDRIIGEKSKRPRMQFVLLLLLALQVLQLLNATAEEKEAAAVSVTSKPELRVAANRILRFVRKKEMKRKLFSESTKELMLLVKVRLRKARMDKTVRKKEQIAALQRIFRNYAIKCPR